MTTIHTCWTVIEKYLKEYSPDAYRTLAPPAEESQIARLVEALPMTLPDSFIQSLLIHNGQKDEEGLFPLFDYQHFLSCDQILSTYDMMNELFSDEDIADYIEPEQCREVRRYCIWNKMWLPITDSDGSGYLLDFHPGLLGVEGQIFYRPNSDNPPDKVWARTYEEWLTLICLQLENGEFHVEDGMIVCKKFTFDW